MIRRLACAPILALLVAACTPQQGAQAASDAKAALSAVQEGCVLDQLLNAYEQKVDPPVANALASVCQIDQALAPAVQQLLDGFNAAPAVIKQRAKRAELVHIIRARASL